MWNQISIAYKKKISIFRICIIFDSVTFHHIALHSAKNMNNIVQKVLTVTSYLKSVNDICKLEENTHGEHLYVEDGLHRSKLYHILSLKMVRFLESNKLRTFLWPIKSQWTYSRKAYPLNLKVLNGFLKSCLHVGDEQ